MTNSDLDWKYKLWTEDENLIRVYYKELEGIYTHLPRNILRVDMIRYIYMHQFGVLYLDVDYEFLRLFDFARYDIVLPNEGDGAEVYVGNSILASEPHHSFWNFVLKELKENPPVSCKNEYAVIDLTGPGFLTKVYHKYFLNDASLHIPEKQYFNPNIPRNRLGQKRLESDGVTIGIHHYRGSWRDSVSLMKRILNKIRKVLQR